MLGTYLHVPKGRINGLCFFLFENVKIEILVCRDYHLKQPLIIYRKLFSMSFITKKYIYIVIAFERLPKDST